MKRGNCCCIPIKIGIDIDTVYKIEFLFKQGKNKKYVVYPSDEAKRRDGEDIIDVRFAGCDTILFAADKRIYMDTRIHILGTTEQPDTPIVYFYLNDTLFEEAVDDDRS